MPATTTISAGTLQIGSGGTTGSLGTGAVVNSGTLAFNRSDAVTVANAISGGGPLRQTGAGTTVLTAANTYSGTTTISAGTLQIGSGGTTRHARYRRSRRTTPRWSFNRATRSPLAASSAARAGCQVGTGTTTLTGANTYSGTTTISAGTLQIGNGGTTGALGTARSSTTAR